MQATPHIVRMDGVECRVWKGVTAGGVACKVFVHRVAVRDTDDCRQFEAELAEQLPPGRAIDLRYVLG